MVVDFFSSKHTIEQLIL